MAIGARWYASAARKGRAPGGTHSIAESFVNAKAERRQYGCTASEADIVHGWCRNGIRSRPIPARPAAA
ncbi:hypothetical protein D8B34_02970 [Verminephrobacter eiseniae]|nr:hypothetical protein ET532_009915 [Verminephrobacter sp. Larva24]MCW5234416.1 hypothetical protein [Verminephrobacter eiseniae]MCW5294008.1 hypothetical protein [Verminephrobacter eiseniae]MCW8183254.1 hypothetical protein [Verminephrobacter eiseniae]MCW8224842.1 hypothetical protein [Verminephrobacter eiseniae]